MSAKRRRRTRRLGMAASVAAHLGLGAVLLVALGTTPAFTPFDPPVPIPVTLAPPLPPPEPPPRAPAPQPAAAPPPPTVRRALPPPPDVAPLRVEAATEPAPMPSLSAGELAGARTAGSGAGGAGPGGTPCDMVARLQAALRDDPEVRAAAAGAHRAAGGGGRAVLVWDGDWVLSPGQSGKGLAGVRQAIAVEVAFAPEACRSEPMQGLVVLVLADGPAAPRLALGAGRWRWTDLVGARR